MSQMRLKMMDGRKNNMKFAKCEYGTLLSDSNLYTHYKIVHKLKNSQITEAARHLEFKPINNSNNNNPNPKTTPSTTTMAVIVAPAQTPLASMKNSTRKDRNTGISGRKS
jgi:signal recognition particle subunit SEC65